MLSQMYVYQLNQLLSHLMFRAYIHLYTSTSFATSTVKLENTYSYCSGKLFIYDSCLLKSKKIVYFSQAF